MNYQALSPKYAVSPQIRPEDVAQLKADGFKIIVSNRPDGEAEDQPTAAEIRAACDQAGLEFRHYPMNGPEADREHVAALQQLLTEDRKIFAFCRSGNRSSIFFQKATE